MDSAPASNLRQTLLNRFRDLEASQMRQQEQLQALLQDKARAEEGEEETRTRKSSALREIERNNIPGFFSNGVYWSALQSIGHAVHVSRAATGHIIFWNRSAENLYGWNDYEVIGRRAMDILVGDDISALDRQIMESWIVGQSWSGQLPLRKRSGEVFMAMVTNSPLYEDGEFVGIISVSSDAAVFNNINLENLRKRSEHAHDRPREWKLNMKKVQWHPQPQIASSVSNLASKVFSLQHGGSSSESASSAENRGSIQQQTESAQEEKTEKPPHHQPTADNLGNAGRCIPRPPTRLKVIPTESHRCDFEKGSASPRKSFLHARIGGWAAGNNNGINKNFEDSAPSFKKSECCECFAMPTYGDRSPPPMPDNNENEYEQISPENQHENIPTESMEHHHPEFKQCPTPSSSERSTGSNHTCSNKDEKDQNAVVDCETRWEDIVLMEEIGHGSYGVVYHGIWRGSDVAVKVYTGNEIHEQIFLDYKKEIAIMKRLRHPNVLLFMGAVDSPEQFGIVTELLPRGSLFRVLHKSNQVLDIRRRLRMATDVARGMNYLHCRNPPIVHRDLKSSNLLVDKNWTVKVGDFGLSRLKNSTFLTTKSGRGTPQWMAPEVLRNEPSNEKSDVYSFGVVLWELMTMSIPWTQLNSLQVVGVVGFMDRRLDVPESLEPRISSIINDCWRSDPRERPSFEHILQRMTDAMAALVGAPGWKKSGPHS